MPEFFTQYIYTLNTGIFWVFLVIFKKVNIAIEAI